MERSGLMQKDLKKNSLIYIFVIFCLGWFAKYFAEITSGLWQDIDFLVKIATIVNAGAVFGVGLIWFQIKTGHESKRREKSVDLLLKWNESLKRETSAARKIVEGLNKEQCISLFNQEEFIVTEKQENLIKKLLVETIADGAIDKDRRLNSTIVLKLRWLTVSYLNLLESILIAWQYSVVDREIIESQFSYLFDASNGCDGLSLFREVCGDDESYPAIKVFCAHIKGEKERKLISKGNVA